MKMDTDTGLGLPDADRSRPPVRTVGPFEWMRTNLFATWYDTLLTTVFGAGFVAGLWWLIRYLVTADLTILRVNLAFLMVGRFPRDELWRVAVSVILVGIVVGLASGLAVAAARERAEEAGLAFDPPELRDVLRRFWPALGFVALLLLLTETLMPTAVAIGAVGAGWLGRVVGRALPGLGRRIGWLVVVGLLVATFQLLAGSGRGWDEWGGFHLNVFLTVFGIVLAFPFGLLLALGRRSTLPGLRALSITYIELIRGVPLITLLLMGIFVIGFFLPDFIDPSNVTRVLIAIVLFESAYIAEIVRGGLQSVPKGQVEASQALGMPAWKTTRLIVLPQALRATIPAMVGQFISLFKDTTLVVVVGLVDILGASQAANAQPDFLAQGLHRYTLPFVGLAFWVGSYVMSREARRLERRLGVGER